MRLDLAGGIIASLIFSWGTEDHTCARLNSALTLTPMNLRLPLSPPSFLCEFPQGLPEPLRAVVHRLPRPTITRFQQ